MSIRRKLRTYHVWLGWLVGIPILLWTLSGVVMVIKPIEEVRGAHLLAEAPPVRLDGIAVPPAVAGVPLQSLTLEPRAAGPRWVAKLPSGGSRLADPSTGRWLSPLSAADAADEVLARYRGGSQIKGVRRVDRASVPLEFRRDVPAWQVEMRDGVRFYIDAGSGQILATRTPWWRFYDLMWGFHIMDLKTREDMHNPLVVSFGIAALAMAFLALALLPMTIRRRRLKPEQGAQPRP